MLIKIKTLIIFYSVRELYKYNPIPRTGNAQVWQIVKLSLWLVWWFWLVWVWFYCRRCCFKAVPSSIDSHSPITTWNELVSLDRPVHPIPQHRVLTGNASIPVSDQAVAQENVAAANHVFIMLLNYLKCLLAGWEWHSPITVAVGSCISPSSRSQTKREDIQALEIKLLFPSLAASWWVVIVPFLPKIFNVFQTVPFIHGIRGIWWPILQSPAEFPLICAIPKQS